MMRFCNRNALGVIGNRPGEPGIDLAAPGDFIKINRPHCAQIGEQGRRIGSRRDIDDDQPPDLGGMDNAASIATLPPMLWPNRAAWSMPRARSEAPRSSTISP